MYPRRAPLKKFVKRGILFRARNVPHVVGVQRQSFKIDKQSHDANEIVLVDSIVLVDHKPLDVSKLGCGHVLH